MVAADDPRAGKTILDGVGETGGHFAAADRKDELTRLRRIWRISSPRVPPLPAMIASSSKAEIHTLPARAAGSIAHCSVLADLWVSARETTVDPWSAPVNLGATVNSTSIDQQPFIASDRETLFFASDRPGGVDGPGRLDLYMTTREKNPHD